MAIELESITKIYPNPHTGRAVPALRGVDLHIPKGSFTSIIGPSGAGKSTLLKIIAGLEKPTSGKVNVLGKDIDLMSESDLTSFRFNDISILHQDPSLNLFPHLTVLENIMIPQLMKSKSKDIAKKFAMNLLKQLNILYLAKRTTSSLSMGEAMRVALAASVAKDPAILLCDEPTGQLDYVNSFQLISLLKQLHTEKGLTIIVVSHDPLYFNFVERSYFIYGGKLGAIYFKPKHEIMEIREANTKSQKQIYFDAYIDRYSYVYLPDEIKKFLNLKEQLRYIVDFEKKIVYIEKPQRDNLFVHSSKSNSSGIPDVSIKSNSCMLADHKVAVYCQNLRKYYKQVEIFNDFNLTVKRGEFVFILGPSGIGKTTLFNIVSGMDLEFAGNVEVLGIKVSPKNNHKLEKIRRKKLFYISQYANLYPKATLKENIWLFLKRAGNKINPTEITHLMKYLNLYEIRDSNIENYSEGEKRRAAVLLAISLSPQLILADEPTANLDEVNKKRVLRALLSYHKQGNTVLLITHDIFSLLPNSRLIMIKNGKVHTDKSINNKDLKRLKEQYLAKKSIFN